MQARTRARLRNDFAEGDRIRDALKTAGCGGPRWCRLQQLASPDVASSTPVAGSYSGLSSDWIDRQSLSTLADRA